MISVISLVRRIGETGCRFAGGRGFIFTLALLMFSFSATLRLQGQQAPAPQIIIRYADPGNSVKIGDSLLKSEPFVVEVRMNGGTPPSASHHDHVEDRQRYDADA